MFLCLPLIRCRCFFSLSVCLVFYKPFQARASCLPFYKVESLLFQTLHLLHFFPSPRVLLFCMLAVSILHISKHFKKYIFSLFMISCCLLGMFFNLIFSFINLLFSCFHHAMHPNFCIHSLLQLLYFSCLIFFYQVLLSNFLIFLHTINIFLCFLKTFYNAYFKFWIHSSQ